MRHARASERGLLSYYVCLLLSEMAISRFDTPQAARLWRERRLRAALLLFSDCFHAAAFQLPRLPRQRCAAIRHDCFHAAAFRLIILFDALIFSLLRRCATPCRLFSRAELFIFILPLMIISKVR
jgi:hypothetical protein